MKRSFVSVPILVVLSVFCFLYHTTVFVAIDQWLGLNTSLGLMNASIFTLLALMSVVTYGIAIVKDPGLVPFAYVPDMEDSESPIHEIKRKGGDPRYCQKCSHDKPPRAHHCLVCKKCVLRMERSPLYVDK